MGACAGGGRGGGGVGGWEFPRRTDLLVILPHGSVRFFHTNLGVFFPHGSVRNFDMSRVLAPRGGLLGRFSTRMRSSFPHGSRLSSRWIFGLFPAPILGQTSIWKGIPVPGKLGPPRYLRGPFSGGCVGWVGLRARTPPNSGSAGDPALEALGRPGARDGRDGDLAEAGCRIHLPGGQRRR